MEGWITIHRKLFDWEWYNNSEMVHLFIHLLLKANREKREWMGIEVNRGQLVTGRKKLSNDTGISERTIRTCINRLKSTNEIAIKSTSQYSIITICNYDIYQSKKKKATSKTTSKTPTSDQQVTTNNNITIEQYNIWLSETENVKYKSFIKWFISENFEQCMKLDEQLSEEKFNKLIAKYPPEKIQTTISAMENKKDLLKKYKSFYLTLNNWLKNA